MIRALLSAITVALVLAHAALSHADTKPTSYTDGAVIAQDTSWSGRVEVEGVVFVPEGVTLTIAPGTIVAFKKSSAQYKEEGVEGSTLDVLIPGSGIRVEGKVLAVGGKGKPISFTYAGDNPSPGAWGCIFLDHSKGSIFEYCRFEYSTYTIHAHFSQFDVSRCTITNNEDGSRIGYSRVLYDHCDITDNAGKGLNFYQCKNTVRHCNITGNRDGIFLNEKDAACTIENNNIHGNTGMDLRLGDFHAEDVTLKANWWGTAEASLIARKVWDREDDPNIGKAVIEPAKAEVIDAGVYGVELKVLWKFKTGGFVDCNPAVDNGVVYFGSWDKNFYALNEKTGEPVWSFQTGDCVDSSPAVSEGRVFFGSWDKNFYAVKADTGESVWRFQTGDCVDSSPAVSEGRVFFGSWDRNIYCLDKKDGKQIWKFEMPPSNFDDHRQASPIVHSYFVIVGGFDGMMYGLSINSGNPLWGFKTGASIRSKACIGSPYSLNDEFEQNRNPPIKYKDGFIGSEDGNLYSFKLDKGKIYWKYSVGEKITSSPIRSRKGFIYIGSQKGTLFCISERDGKKVWDYQTGGRIEYSSPLITENLVLIGDCNGTLHAVNKDTGKLVWKFTGGGGIYSSPQMVKDRVVYGDNAGNVYCLDLKTGKPLGLFRAGGAVQGLSTGPDGTIYAGSRDGYLYALSLSH